MTKRFSDVNPTEKVILTFQFADGLSTGESLVGPPSAEVLVSYGTVTTPSAIIQEMQASGTDVLVAVANLTVDADYHIIITCTTSDPAKILACAGILPVRKL